MQGERNLSRLIQQMTPYLNEGSYVFATVSNLEKISREDTLGEFKEAEGVTIILEQSKADQLKLEYEFKAAWITLKVHSSLEAIGLTAVFADALAQNNISCNVMAGFYHDHIFVSQEDAEKAMQVLQDLSSLYKKID